MNTGVFTKDGVSYYLMTMEQWNKVVARLDEGAPYWYQRYTAERNMNARLTDQIRLMTEQTDYWFNLYNEEVEAHTATLEALEDAEWRAYDKEWDFDYDEPEYPTLEEDWIN